MDKLSLIAFDLLLTAATYCLALRLLSCRLAAFCSALLVNCYPITINVSHRALLEFPMFAFVSLSMLIFVWWRQCLAWLPTIALGMSWGAGLLSKQLAACFFAGPFVGGLVGLIRYRQPIAVFKLLAAAAVAIACFAPWYCLNSAELHRLAHEFSSAYGTRQGMAVYINNACSYLQSLPFLISVFLLLHFLIACRHLPAIGMKIWPVALSAGGGAMLLCSLPWADNRYLLPFVTFPALVSAHAVAQGLRSGRLWRQMSAAGSVLAAFVQFLLLSFSPYPIPVRLPDLCAGSLSRMNPLPPGDRWGQEWAIDAVQRATGNSACYLNLLPSTRHLNVHTLQAVARDKKSNLYITTNRRWTVVGDRASFSPEQLRYYDWFLLKSGDQGFVFASRNDAKQFDLMSQHIMQNSDIELYGSRQVDDGSTISLYRRRTR